MNNMETELRPEKAIETPKAETVVETEPNAITGAQMLESPPDGSFIHGLQLFIAWVKTLVADDK